jgi:hypothetical protein
MFSIVYKKWFAPGPSLMIAAAGTRPGLNHRVIIIRVELSQTGAAATRTDKSHWDNDCRDQAEKGIASRKERQQGSSV